MPQNHEKITTNFGHIFPAHVEALCELLIVLRQQFFGDLDLMLILAIIGSRALPARLAQNMTYSQFITDNSKERADQPINIQSIAECSAIPRETVRRKVHKLQELGFIERDSSGILTITSKAMSQLMPATEASLQYLIALSASSDVLECQSGLDEPLEYK
ncbi:helix-turn-helix domain-containing protein [Pseudomonas sp. C27(2019)]|uniref:helix-turn-helix domain-containing protein n=1 Tax=Pseudomonas sp. C27(2019) TaxID=2604941 RepID=UPI001244E747|nr:helix-turn-helix domain-containing protein [Pseudomonas sp. C27(2019)]QEY59059.1 helix-turn-helix domain-containing protein [Pseudomonas sp. C27(2019)]